MLNLNMANDLVFRIKDIWYHWMLNWSLQGCRSVLDVGCGASSPLAYARRNKITEGIDVYSASVRDSKKKKIHDSYRIGDIRKLGHLYPAKSYDAVIALDVIEHLTRKEGLKLISDMETIARKKIIVMTPNGFYRQLGLGGNRFQVHHSGWRVMDFKKLHFRTFGIRGLKWLRHEHATLRFKPWFFWGLVSFVSEPMLMIFSELSYQIFAVKNVTSESK